VKHAIKIDRKNKNSFWADALKKEMGNVCVAFEILGQNTKATPGWFKASGHIVFDVKMDFTRKAHWVKDGHKIPDLKTSSFAGVVSRDSIQIALTHAALLSLPVMGADIRNAYFQLRTWRNTLSFVVLSLGSKKEPCCIDKAYPLWWQSCRTRLLASPTRLHGSPRILLFAC